MLTWLKPILFMYLLGENNLWVLWLSKTLNAWIAVTRRNEFMRFAHWTGHFWWTIQWIYVRPSKSFPSGPSRDQWLLRERMYEDQVKLWMHGSQGLGGMSSWRWHIGPVTFDGLSDKPLSDPLSLYHLVQSDWDTAPRCLWCLHQMVKTQRVGQWFIE